MKERLIVALDGHDGAGKSTLAVALANRLCGRAVRPFSGATGAKLMSVGDRGDVIELIGVGNKAIEKAISSVPDNVPIVLDRGWMTVASFIPNSDEFFKQWKFWVPTALCWAELEVTLSRLAVRNNEKHEPLEWHKHYLEVYKELAMRSGSFIVRTDLIDLTTCINHLAKWAIIVVPENRTVC